MHADFLIMLVNRANWVILNDSEVRWLKIALFYERLRNAALSNDEAQAVNEWAVILRGFVTELLSLQAANELICNKYFEGECILLKDLLEELEQQIKMVQNMMDAYDLVATKAGQPERTTDSHTLRKIISEAWLGPTRFPSPSPLVNCQPGPVGLSFCRLHPRDPGEVRHGSVEFSINDVTTR